MYNANSEMFTRSPEMVNEVLEKLKINLKLKGFREYERAKVVEWIKIRDR